ncbi:IgA FC receptor [Trichinella zimbabwensis]|uniref:IgA FC receptor n=1 Tax=Trichinella zimbabwensis TaxID=268475 RepID=A0A0V1GYF4_9BILA|nr:IgA FC receptor [Trichinella zimbabwensis]
MTLSCFIHLKWLNTATFVALIFLKIAYSLHDAKTISVGQPCIPNSAAAICQSDSAHTENLPNSRSQIKTWTTEQSQPQNRANQQTLEYVKQQIYLINFPCNKFNFRKSRRKTTNAHHFKEQPSDSAVKYYTCVPDKASNTCGVWKLKKCPNNKRFRFSKQACVEGSISLRQGWFYPSMLPQSYMGGPFHGGFSGPTFDPMSMYGYGMPNYGMDYMSYGYGSMGYPMQVNYPGFSVIPPPVPLPPANQGAGNAPPPPPNQPQAPPTGNQPQTPAAPPAAPPASAPAAPPAAPPPAAPQPTAPAAPATPGKTPSAKPSLPGGLPKPKLPGKLPIPGKG